MHIAFLHSFFDHIYNIAHLNNYTYACIPTVLNSTPQWKDLLKLITPNYSAHWKIIGAVLGIAKGCLDGIESCFPASSFKCCNRMLEMWLETNASVKWMDVITAIDSPAIQFDLLPEISEDFIGMLVYFVITGICTAYR